MKKVLLIFILTVGFFFATIYFFPSLSDSECIWDKKFKEIELNGVVEKKYLDSIQHSYPMIEIRQFGIDTLIMINLIGDTTNSYYKIELGDTIKKSKGNNLIRLRKKNAEFAVTVDFGCKDPR